MVTRKAIALAGICLLAACALIAQASKWEGTWEGKMDHEGRMETITLQLHAKDKALTGKVLRGGEEFGDITGAW